jgi:hypothetical protein
MPSNTQFKLYVWSGPIRLVGHFDSPMDAARKLFRRIMDANRVWDMDDVIEISFMGFEQSTIRLDASAVLMTMKLSCDPDGD